MKNQPQNANEILSQSVPGFHQYCLCAPAHLTFVSSNLCSMLGLSAEALLSGGEDCYLQQVHPADRPAFVEFLGQLAVRAQTCTAQYRLVKFDGSILYVRDTMTSYCLNGVMMGDSVLADITDLKSENENLQFLNETMPCGFLKYTCEKNPRITYINDQMKQFLRFPEHTEAGFDHLELYKQNIYMLVPAEARRRFSIYLERVYKNGGPIAGEMPLLRGDGTKAYVFGWVTKCVNAQGVEEFQSACMDITQLHHIQKERETKRYLKALTEVYDKIFEFDLSARTVKCLYAPNSPMFRWIKDIPMQMEDARDKWILGTVFEADREKVRTFFSDFCQKKFANADTPPVVRYRALASGGILRTYTGLFVKIDAAISLFCCRSMPDAAEADTLRSENTSLKENMQNIVRRFTDGLAAFEIVDDMVTPLYASDNVCQFFGFAKDQWVSVMEKRTPIREFVSRSRVAYEDFAELLAKGEAEFTYYDLNCQKERRIKAICSERTPGGSAPRYVMLYSVGQAEDHRESSRVYIRTFGYFDVFVDEKPIAFRNEKSKELFALLVDRRGGFVSSEEAISFLWEDESANTVTLARYRKVALRLKNILEEYGISDIVESVNGKRRLVTEKVQCDLYDYLSGGAEFAQLFKGSYLTNYSWGENTLAELSGGHLYGIEGP